MKHLVLVFLIVSCFACNVSDKKAVASSEPPVTPSTSVDPATSTTIEWIDSTTINLGSIKKGQVVELSWKFKNTGDKPLVVQDFQGTCGCTAAEKPIEPIAPGEEGVLKARYDSKGDMGHVNKQVTLYANLKNHNNVNDTKLGFIAEVKE